MLTFNNHKVAIDLCCHTYIARIQTKMASPQQNDTIKVLMHGRLTPRDLEETFSAYGAVKHIHPFVEPKSTSNYYKYCTYVTFSHSNSATRLLSEKNEIQIKGIRVQVRLENIPSPPTGVTSTSPSPQRCPIKTVKISMLNGKLSEDRLEQVFTRFGPLQTKPIVRGGDPFYSYINFQDHGDALKACMAVHEKVIDGVEIKSRLYESKGNKQLTQVSTQPQELLQYPETWQKQDTDPSLFNVAQGTGEWTNVTAQVASTLPQARILSIERIQNKKLWENYDRGKQQISGKNSGVVNEKQLFHGSGETPPEKIYNGNKGFDFRYCTSGMWGRGSYFAVNASYSDQYSYKSVGSRQMFLATVLTGDTCRMGSDPRLTHPPLKPGSVDERYDSVSGQSGGSDVFVVYDFEQAYPSYLITYTKPY